MRKSEELHDYSRAELIALTRSDGCSETSRQGFARADDPFAKLLKNDGIRPYVEFKRIRNRIGIEIGIKGSF